MAFREVRVPLGAGGPISWCGTRLPWCRCGAGLRWGAGLLTFRPPDLPFFTGGDRTRTGDFYDANVDMALSATWLFGEPWRLPGQLLPACATRRHEMPHRSRSGRARPSLLARPNLRPGYRETRWSCTGLTLTSRSGSSKTWRSRPQLTSAGTLSSVVRPPRCGEGMGRHPYDTGT
jgi:hypothetical protein